MNDGVGFDPAIAVDHLRAHDETLARVIDSVGPFRLQLIGASSIFGALAQAIVYQQLNGKAAATIFARFCALFPGTDPTAEQVLAASEDDLRAAGLSRSKLLSLRDLAGKTVGEEIPTLAEIRNMEDDAIIERLTSVRGIGRWTVEMLLMYSLELNRPVSFPRYQGTNLSPAWSSDGKWLAFSSSRSGDSEIYVVDVSGGGPRRLTNTKGPDVSPTWNPKTNAQIAWVSGQTGLPQIYTMASDGTNVVRMTDQGYAVSPSWSPNGQFLALAWIRHYGPGAPGASDIYVMDIASKQWVQLTHDGGRNDFPTWSPDGRHIAFQSNRTGKTQIWSMLADGSQARQLTTSGENSQPNWSFK